MPSSRLGPRYGCPYGWRRPLNRRRTAVDAQNVSGHKSGRRRGKVGLPERQGRFYTDPFSRRDPVELRCSFVERTSARRFPSREITSPSSFVGTSKGVAEDARPRGKSASSKPSSTPFELSLCRDAAATTEEGPDEDEEVFELELDWTPEKADPPGVVKEVAKEKGPARSRHSVSFGFPGVLNFVRPPCRASGGPRGPRGVSGVRGLRLFPVSPEAPPRRGGQPERVAPFQESLAVERHVLDVRFRRDVCRPFSGFQGLVIPIDFSEKECARGAVRFPGGDAFYEYSAEAYAAKLSRVTAGDPFPSRSV